MMNNFLLYYEIHVFFVCCEIKLHAFVTLFVSETKTAFRQHDEIQYLSANDDDDNNQRLDRYYSYDFFLFISKFQLFLFILM